LLRPDSHPHLSWCSTVGPRPTGKARPRLERGLRRAGSEHPGNSGGRATLWVFQALIFLMRSPSRINQQASDEQRHKARRFARMLEVS